MWLVLNSQHGTILCNNQDLWNPLNGGDVIGGFTKLQLHMGILEVCCWSETKIYIINHSEMNFLLCVSIFVQGN